MKCDAAQLSRVSNSKPLPSLALYIIFNENNVLYH